jgi:hypothetical protein
LLKGTRSGVVQRIQPVSIHGQISLDVFWIDPEETEQELRHARVGNEAVPRDLHPGDTVTLHFLMGMVTQITK